MLSRQRVLGVKVVSQPVLLFKWPSRSNVASQIAPRAVSAMNSLSPSLAKAIPLATSEVEPSTKGGPGGVGQPVVLRAALRDVGVTVIVPCGSQRTSRPTPPTPLTRFTTFAIGCTRKTSSQLIAGGDVQLAPGPAIFQILP